MEILLLLYASLGLGFAWDQRTDSCIKVRQTVIVGLKALLSCYWWIHARLTRLIWRGLELILNLFHPLLPLRHHRLHRPRRLQNPRILPRVVEGRDWKKLWVLKY